MHLSRTRDFVYVPNENYLRVLDDFCGEKSIAAKKALDKSDCNNNPLGSASCQPLVIFGNTGSGKSALLAYWAARRQNSSIGKNEYIFTHFCGCTYESIKIGSFLHRLFSHLKKTFKLHDFDVPQEKDEEKLRFSLIRCLEGALNKTKFFAKDLSAEGTKVR